MTVKLCRFVAIVQLVAAASFPEAAKHPGCHTDIVICTAYLPLRRSRRSGKSRLVPLHPSTRTALRRYLQRRNDYFRRRDIEPFFVSHHGTRMGHNDAWKSLVRLSRKIGLRGPSNRRGPRLHDFRHRVAVQAMLRCYRSGVDPERRLPALSTYLGHGDLHHTYWYLHQSPALMKQAVVRLERCWERAP